MIGKLFKSKVEFKLPPMPIELVEDKPYTDDIRVVYFFDKQHPKGGVTVAYRPTLRDSKNNPQGIFGEVAVAYCHPKEAFNRKAGKQLATQNLLSGNSIKLPIYAWGHPVRKLRSFFYE